jgi:hypothetical protein
MGALLLRFFGSVVIPNQSHDEQFAVLIVLPEHAPQLASPRASKSRGCDERRSWFGNCIDYGENFLEGIGVRFLCRPY